MTYFDSTPKEEKVQIYYDVLKLDYTDEEFEKTIVLVMKNVKISFIGYFPSIADFYNQNRQINGHPPR